MSEALNDSQFSSLSTKAAIEALLFISEKPLMIDQIKGVFEDIEPGKLREIVLELKHDYENAQRGLRIAEVAGGFQIVTSLEAAEILKKFYKLRDAQRLSKSALETLAIIAYKQPVTRLDIESLRGVNVDSMVRNLLEKNLIRITGKKEVIGRPLVYGTSRQFLEYFGLASLEDLPKIEEFVKNAEAASSTLLTFSNRTEAFIADTSEAHETSPEPTQVVSAEESQDKSKEGSAHES